ncbi:phage antirepressor [Thermosyntropha sp.]|uniref:phage antirepressor n=1 Tax=Thermosyntropha sp. TaxID=2740820 RepID=UPI0025D8E515|nr:phage antirepressor [Thermosyntropha sp.]MBO8158856.1 phage antirepressor KilAC domain-containing protein [Thermosyntropha sp.]
MNNLQVFKNTEFGELNVLIIDEKPYFPATECARILGYSNPHDAIFRHCKGLVKHEVLTPGGSQEINFIPEGDLYRLIIRSKLPAAERFERWVFDEILPTIRKHGAYMTPEKIEEVLLNPDTIISLAQQLKAEQETRKALETKIEEDKPKTIFADAVSASQTSILVGDLAKLLKQNGVEIGQKRLFQYLRENGYLIKSGNSKNMPTQKAMEKGLFEIKERTITNPDGSIRITKTPKVTGKGQIYFINHFLAKQRKEVSKNAAPAQGRDNIL